MLNAQLAMSISVEINNQTCIKVANLTNLSAAVQLEPVIFISWLSQLKQHTRGFGVHNQSIPVAAGVCVCVCVCVRACMRACVQLRDHVRLNEFIDLLNSVVNDFINSNKALSCSILLGTTRCLVSSTTLLKLIIF